VKIKVVCSLFHFWYFLAMWIHLFSAGKLLFTGSCMVSIPSQKRMICEIKVVYSFFHLRYLLTMCNHLFSGGKLLFNGSYMVSIPTQQNDLRN